MEAQYRDFEILDTAYLTRPALQRLCEIAHKDWKDVKKRLPRELAYKLQQIARHGVGGTVRLERGETLALALALDLGPGDRQGLADYTNDYPRSAPLFAFLEQGIPRSHLFVFCRLALWTMRELEGTETRLRCLRGVLKGIRKVKGLTQDTVAQRTGWPQEKISEIENGRLRGRTAKERAKELHRYLEAIGCTEEERQRIVKACGRGFTIGVA